jgi:hypothetical protein
MDNVPNVFLLYIYIFVLGPFFFFFFFFKCEAFFMVIFLFLTEASSKGLFGLKGKLTLSMGDGWSPTHAWPALPLSYGLRTHFSHYLNDV